MSNLHGLFQYPIPMKLHQKWIVSFALLLGFSYLMQWQGAALKNSFTPMGIVHLEFAQTEELFQKIVASWDVQTLRWNIAIDFLYIPIYTYFFQLTLSIFAHRHRSKLVQQMGILLKNAILLAFFCDLAENTGMIISLMGFHASIIYILTFGLAGLKFAILGFSLIYILVSIPTLFFRTKQN
ncbi:hypothetical protein AQEC111735_10535 [Aquirufa ecclesiirivi]|uniref:hypothetical protein n=2 Tax=Aquirufa ecclesiirivi TaxID=2715124 RepID=UPI00140D58B2|nr:hypothetical protein [Aquirufa ecclesiirivi]NHC48097.1 hypothetical protein [Aquirufa ecclesiirivi]